ncbi:MAG: histidine phosphatase family protein [Rickettsiales bacterium]|nr:histidine phosphatase family protein [Pseudomonadota bacterium]MDA0967150.1 histidine phosphatase family protein [Pseudomonadota bacterium]MDG4544335.1 histidine phosphatase family protein [Rickettsiales bacterium]MDG4546465.1 histidine phosphatase family protein [Rickettsiales bacterium]MDG4548611.1 histidine phosphatase family protein [Rickettsiales bacterium]
MTGLLIARHGNTFDKGDVLLRVGKRTDIPLSVSGKEQALTLGKFLLHEGLEIDEVFSSNLKRTKDTAKIALENMGRSDIGIMPMDIFDEIDYGLDEGKPEDEVVARIGRENITKWDEQAIAPEGWIVDVDKIKDNWKEFADSIKDSNKNILVVTSNGIARFAPYILNNPDEFISSNNIKLSTGAVSCFLYKNGNWEVEYWNKKPAF